MPARWHRVQWGRELAMAAVAVSTVTVMVWAGSLAQFGGIVLGVGLAAAGLVSHRHHRRPLAMQAMVVSTAGTLFGSALALAVRQALGHPLPDPGMALAMASMAGMVGATIGSGRGLGSE
jgi:hypothetical protein